MGNGDAMDSKRVAILAAIGAVITISFVVYASQVAQSSIAQPTSASKETNDPQDVKTQVIEAEASEKEVWEQLGLPYDSDEGETEEVNQTILDEDARSEAIERELARVDAKEGTTYAMVLADDRVKTELEGVLDITSDFVPFEGRQTDVDVMTLTVTGREILEGSWQTEYVSTLTNRFALEIQVKNGTIESIERTELDDIRTVFTYTDEEKGIIRTALEIPEMEEALSQKGDVQIAISVYTLISKSLA